MGKSQSSYGNNLAMAHKQNQVSQCLTLHQLTTIYTIKLESRIELIARHWVNTWAEKAELNATLMSYNQQSQLPYSTVANNY